MRRAEAMFNAAQRRSLPTPMKNGEETSSQYFEITRLPHEPFQEVWDGLIGIDETLEQVISTLRIRPFVAQARLSHKLASGNIILFVGYPGTGKTAMAQAA